MSSPSHHPSLRPRQEILQDFERLKQELAAYPAVKVKWSELEQVESTSEVPVERRIVSVEVGVAEARKSITALISEVAASGRAVRIRNERNPAASAALLLSEESLSRLLEHERRPGRTMGELLATLPRSGVAIARLHVDVPDDDVMPELRLSSPVAVAEEPPPSAAA